MHIMNHIWHEIKMAFVQFSIACLAHAPQRVGETAQEPCGKKEASFYLS